MDLCWAGSGSECSSSLDIFYRLHLCLDSDFLSEIEKYLLGLGVHFGCRAVVVSVSVNVSVNVPVVRCFVAVNVSEMASVSATEIFEQGERREQYVSGFESDRVRATETPFWVVECELSCAEGARQTLNRDTKQRVVRLSLSCWCYKCYNPPLHLAAERVKFRVFQAPNSGRWNASSATSSITLNTTIDYQVTVVGGILGDRRTSPHACSSTRQVEAQPRASGPTHGR